MTTLLDHDSTDPRLSAFRDFAVSLPEAQSSLCSALLAENQHHLFTDWDPAGTRDDAKHAFLDSLLHADQSYPGGLTAYICNARKLLTEASAGTNPFEGYTPTQPDIVDLTGFGTDYDKAEATGLHCLAETAIILVAGGLGERLGYQGIKLDIPLETTESTSYLAHYASFIRAASERCGRSVPLVIMTSRDTHQGTLATLKANANFGLAEDQITILRQELVPALSDLNASLALDEKYQLALKPHGHGDIHMLLHSSGTAKRLANAGIRYLLFIQDTNGQVFNAALAAIGVSEERGYDFNSIAVNRVPGEAVGAIARLVKPGRPDLTLNVEYNQLDPLLRATISPAGDVPDSRGYSLFPGNINLLVIRLAPYIKVLEASGGVVAEFVNPKFADATRTTFKKPARLETLMQDLPKSFTSGEKTGVTIFDRIWCFSPCKNTLADAASKAAADSPAESASSAENDFYLAGRQKLRMAGMTVTDGPIRSIRGIPFTTGPRVILRPSFALTLQDVRDHIAGGSIAGDASLVLDGPIRLENVVIESGATLHATAAPGATATLSDTTIHRDTTYTLHELTDAEMSSADTPEFLKIRGFRIENPGVKKHQLPVTSSSTKQASA